LDTKDLKDKLVKVDIDIDDKFADTGNGRSNGLQDGSESLREQGVIGDSGATIAHFES
jgi:hypothetical protein